MEFKFALRSLRSNPAFSILAIAILALGIGANTAIFSVVNPISTIFTIKPLPSTASPASTAAPVIP
jgi:hypothetical protein